MELDKKDDIDLFFLSMAKTVKKLPYPKQALLKEDISDSRVIYITCNKLFLIFS